MIEISRVGTKQNRSRGVVSYRKIVDIVNPDISHPYNIDGCLKLMLCTDMQYKMWSLWMDRYFHSTLLWGMWLLIHALIAVNRCQSRALDQYCSLSWRSFGFQWVEIVDACHAKYIFQYGRLVDEEGLPIVAPKFHWWLSQFMREMCIFLWHWWYKVIDSRRPSRQPGVPMWQGIMKTIVKYVARAHCDL